MDAHCLMTQPPKLQTYHFVDDGSIPNNPRLPLLVYGGALRLPAVGDAAAACEALFAAHHWGGPWRNGIYSYHHYHSTAHEALAVVAGQAQVQLGGAQGIVFAIGRRIEIIDQLRRDHGRRRWRKLKGMAWIRYTDGRVAREELHLRHVHRQYGL
jgi:hypothetical protein